MSIDQDSVDDLATSERRLTDRRQDKRRAFAYQFVKSRRHGERRTDSQDAEHYVDVHHHGHLLVILLTLILCVADVYFTLILLNNGGTELNPIMASLIDYDLMVFYAAKYGVTATCLILLLIHRNFRLLKRIPGHFILYSVFAVYVVLIGYEITLLGIASDSPDFSWSPWLV